MSLSRSAPLTSLEVAADIAQALSILSDPKVLKKTIEDMHALSDAERAKSEMARNDIKIYYEAIARQQSHEAELNRSHDEMDAKLTKLDKDKEELVRQASLIVEDRKSVNAMKSDAQATQKLLESRELSVSQREQRASDREVAVSKREADVAAFEKQLKERAEKFRGLTEGL